MAVLESSVEPVLTVIGPRVRVESLRVQTISLWVLSVSTEAEGDSGPMPPVRGTPVGKNWCRFAVLGPFGSTPGLNPESGAIAEAHRVSPTGGTLGQCIDMALITPDGTNKGRVDPAFAAHIDPAQHWALVHI